MHFGDPAYVALGSVTSTTSTIAAGAAASRSGVRRCGAKTEHLTIEGYASQTLLLSHPPTQTSRNIYTRVPPPSNLSGWVGGRVGYTPYRHSMGRFFPDWVEYLLHLEMHHPSLYHIRICVHRINRDKKSLLAPYRHMTSLGRGVLSEALAGF